jgi:hypothetical protein
MHCCQVKDHICERKETETRELAATKDGKWIYTLEDLK